MMDIVEKLRRQADLDEKIGTLYVHEISREAAAEIERLRKRCSPSRVVMIGDVGHYVSEGVAEGIESLRQAVKPFAEFDLLEHRIPPEFAMLVLRARGALERVVVTPNVRSQATDADLSRQVACTDGLCPGSTERTRT